MELNNSFDLTFKWLEIIFWFFVLFPFFFVFNNLLLSLFLPLIFEEKLEVESSKDASIDISFSAKYMLDALKTMKDEDILILLNGEVKPIVIKSVTDESLIQLILPIKTY